MDSFTKQVSGVYQLVHNYAMDLPEGEIIKSYNVYLDSVLVSGVIESGIIHSYEQYDKETVIVGVQWGTHGSGYVIGTDVTTNRSNTYDRSTYLTIDEDDLPYTYNDFYYRFQSATYDRAIYILPDLNNGFTYNKEINVTVNPGISGVYNWTMGDSHSFFFTTQYCPLFTNITTIKLMAGPSIEGFADDTVYRMIYKNSLDAIDIYNTSNGTSYAYSNWGCDPSAVPYQLRRYVECKTAYDLLTLVDMITADGTAQSKQLGDMSIKYGGKPGAQDPGLKGRLYDCFMGTLNIIGGGMKSAVRGIYDRSHGYSHPILDVDHNRIVRTVNTTMSDPAGPWQRSQDWRYSTRPVHRRTF
jgi:hypothetical protein